MPTVDGLMSMRVGTVDGDDIMSPSHSSFNWGDGILTSTCSRSTKCEDAHPAPGCSCGIYSVLDNGLEELNNYVNSPAHVVFVGWAFSTVNIYEWGLRSGQWVAVGVVNWHGKYDDPINPDNQHQPWWDSAYSAVDILRKRHVDNPKLYTLESVSKAIQDQKRMFDEREMVMNQLFGIAQH